MRFISGGFKKMVESHQNRKINCLTAFTIKQITTANKLKQNKTKTQNIFNIIKSAAWGDASFTQA